MPFLLCRGGALGLGRSVSKSSSCLWVDQWGNRELGEPREANRASMSDRAPFPYTGCVRRGPVPFPPARLSPNIFIVDSQLTGMHGAW